MDGEAQSQSLAPLSATGALPAVRDDLRPHVPTLVGGNGGAVRLWAPRRWQHWLVFALSPLGVPFAGIMYLPCYLILFHLLHVHPSLWSLAGWFAWIWLRRSYYRFLRYPYAATDATGIAFSSCRGSINLRWEEITRLVESGGFPEKRPFWMPSVVWFAWPYYVPEWMFWLGYGRSLSIYSTLGGVELNLDGYSYLECLALKKEILERTGLQSDGSWPRTFKASPDRKAIAAGNDKDAARPPMPSD